MNRTPLPTRTIGAATLATGALICGAFAGAAHGAVSSGDQANPRPSQTIKDPKGDVDFDASSKVKSDRAARNGLDVVSSTVTANRAEGTVTVAVSTRAAAQSQKGVSRYLLVFTDQSGPNGEYGVSLAYGGSRKIAFGGAKDDATCKAATISVKGRQVTATVPVSCLGDVASARFSVSTLAETQKSGSDVYSDEVKPTRELPLSALPTGPSAPAGLGA